MKRPVISMSLLVIIALLALILTGCGTGSADTQTEIKSPQTTASQATKDSTVKDTEAPDTTIASDEQAESTEASSQTSAAPALSDTIVLPAGWKIQQAMSLEEMGKITGKVMDFYFYSLDKPAEGKPGGGYYVKDDPKSAENQIVIKVEAEGGQARYDSVKGFAVDGKTEDIAGIGDKAYLCQMGDAGITNTVIAVLKGNLFFRVEVPTQTWKDLSFVPEQLASDIAYQLLENLYNPARQIPAE